MNNISSVNINANGLFGRNTKDLAVIQLAFINVVKFYEEMFDNFYLSEPDSFKGKRFTLKEEKGEYIYYDDFIIYNKCIYYYNEIVEFRNKKANNK